MLNFNAYKKKDLQHCLQLLNQCETAGVNDIRFVREALHKHLYRPQKVRPMKRGKNMPPDYICPECDSQMNYINSGEQMAILGCGKCRYSEVVK